MWGALPATARASFERSLSDKMIRAYGKTILVRPVERSLTRLSGLYIPDTNDERPQEGEIVSVGKRVRHREFKVGRSVYFGRFSPDVLRDGLLALQEQDILAVILDGKPEPVGRILVKMLPILKDYSNKLQLRLISHKKHWEHQFRRGLVEAIDPKLHVDFKEGDVVIFNGASGFTLDGDILDEDDKYEAPLKGESFRWLKVKEVEVVDEGATPELQTVA